METDLKWTSLGHFFCDWPCFPRIFRHKVLKKSWKRSLLWTPVRWPKRSLRICMNLPMFSPFPPVSPSYGPKYQWIPVMAGFIRYIRSENHQKIQEIVQNFLISPDLFDHVLWKSLWENHQKIREIVQNFLISPDLFDHVLWKSLWENHQKIREIVQNFLISPDLFDHVLWKSLWENRQKIFITRKSPKQIARYITNKNGPFVHELSELFL